MLRSHSFLRVLLAVTTLAFVAGLAMSADEAETPNALDGQYLQAIIGDDVGHEGIAAGG